MRELIVSSLILIILDSVFIYLNSGMFSSQIMDIQASPLKINMAGAILSYLCLIGGLNYFILREHRSVLDAFILGLVIYGVYETTTYALLRRWYLKTVITDTLWGGILFSSTTYLTYLFFGYKKIK